MNLFLFITVLIVSIIITRIGAIALELTGLDKSISQFQALSCFTGTGFTTRESELITKHPQRRQISVILMIVGHAGLVTLIATFANTLRPRIRHYDNNILNIVFSSHLLPWLNILIITISIYILYKLFSNKKVKHKLQSYLRMQLLKKHIIKPIHLEELTLLAEGYGVSYADILRNNPLVNKTLSQTKLRTFDITVLAIERDNSIIPNPTARTKIRIGDRLICFGKLANIKQKIVKA